MGTLHKACRGVALGLGMSAAAWLPAASADEFEDVLAETQELYANGEISEVKKNLDYLQQLVAQQRVSSLSDFLPDAIDGWSAKEAEGSHHAMFGGGVTAARSYAKDGKTVTVTIVGDSPMLAQMSMMFSPAVAGASGAKMMRINREQAIAQDDQVSMMVANRWFITADGTASEDDKVGYLKLIDLKGLAAY